MITATMKARQEKKMNFFIRAFDCKGSNAISYRCTRKSKKSTDLVLARLSQLSRAFGNENLRFLDVRLYAVDHLSLLVHHLAQVLEDLVHVPNVTLELFQSKIALCNE